MRGRVARKAFAIGSASLVVLGIAGCQQQSEPSEGGAEQGGEAPPAALVQPIHGGEDILVFRNRLFRYLVEELGFTAIAIESVISTSTD